MKKLVFVVLDGAADTEDERIGWKTALEAADIPNIDFLARNGKNGIMQILPIPPESDEAVISILGYDVFDVYTGRGPLEAVGGGVPFKDGDIALRCNFATVRNNLIVNVRAGYISNKEAKELEKSINQYVTLTNGKFVFKSTANYRGVLVISSKEKLSSKISNTHPGYRMRIFDIVWDRSGEVKSIPLSEAIKNPAMEIKKCVPLEKTKSASLSAMLVNEFIEKSKIILENHPVNKKREAEGKPPANIILVRDAGTKLPKLYSLRKVYGVRWACFADMPVERGIAQLAGMEVIPLPPPSKNIKNDMSIRILTFLKNLNFYDAFYIHLKGPDSFAHIGDIEGKIKAIEDIDKFFFNPLLKYVDLKNTIIVVTCDHTTSSSMRCHTEDPVPISIFGIGEPDNIGHFSETECKKGSLGFFPARNLIGFILKNMR